MRESLDSIAAEIEARLAIERIATDTLELSYEVAADRLISVCQSLRDDHGFEMLMDLCGVDYLHYGLDEWNTSDATGTGFSRGVSRDEKVHEISPQAKEKGRFAVVYHLLSISRNQRVRLRMYCEQQDPPIVDSVIDIWSSANWYEREAFDLFGILFRGHPDLRRILTDYGFIGHPFRKDFPLIGNVEVRYEPEKGRVVYEPVSIEPRTLVPRVIRDDSRYEHADEGDSGV